MHKNPQPTTNTVVVKFQKISYDKNNIFYDTFLRFEYFREPLNVIHPYTHTHIYIYVKIGLFIFRVRTVLVNIC